MNKTFLLAAASAGLTAVAFGAFGAHGLRSIISPENIVLWEKGVQYQFYHAMALFLCYLYLRQENSRMIRNAGWCFLAGIFCFSGSLYLLAIRQLVPFPITILGPITPIGGLFLIIGWGLILMQAFKQK